MTLGQRPAIIKVKSKKQKGKRIHNTGKRQWAIQEKQKLNVIQGKEAIGKEAKSSTNTW